MGIVHIKMNQKFEPIKRECSEQNPIGGTIEPYDIKREEELIDRIEFDEATKALREQVKTLCKKL